MSEATRAGLTTLNTADLLGQLPGSSEDRITEFAYDGLNRIARETRLNVSFESVDPADGAVTTALAHAITTYEYDGLGNNTTRVVKSGVYSGGAQVGQAAGETVTADYGYDALGNRTSERGSSFVDHQGRAVQQYNTFEFDGLGQQVATLRSGRLVGTDTAIAGISAQVTRMVYNKQGDILSQIDPEGQVVNFRYDANGKQWQSHP